MNNLLCSVLLVSVTILILIDADCLNYPNVTNANVDNDCGNVVITCSTGFKMVQGLECIDEEWRYQKPVCKPTECPQGVNITNSDAVTESRIFDQVLTFNCSNGINGLTGAQRCGEDGKWIEEQACPVVYRGKYVGITTFTTVPSTNCTEACLKVTQCSSSSSAGSGRCILFEEPIIYTNRPKTLSECIQLCKNDTKCLTLSHTVGSCYLFSVDYTTIETKFVIRDSSNGVIVSGF
ncbi:hypothetical protein LOTGIDRAFT_175793 [Lottia gigantea]|uniref:PAN-3 domain-containing protein n=1 Tax=Lottia gigantea TaxID=225164 RepID=V4A7D5_LOTGI|nr:hypothetical protein LOTGIDRAFT_175793 [Lottia gigantea]ESO90915.1 hypothetical protein LOTGIDRAFT_175793 [Lottia gigantea]